ncbi:MULTISPECIES: DUF2946 domain-containing protein [Pseudomonas]|jgi:hypothetical protein|uniref:DUF2946 domain-containing protein n=1 Tax=Pseudomonas moraviensis R28-S TaxID=1395516 RepID=V8RGC6_9PSED|nr:MULTISPECIES: DUF2946 domain-containing protein [Pseudomonas]ETF10324.1 hypothetical protein PMO01_02340 [Pseudomonas moraviensis R28-S]KQT65579.1 hypothetical protein ASG55_14195 [Pseudomonas sp. Leaf434]MBV4470275.1 DUF2946 domain-containing protein [Pseudomonas siliginis]UVL95094.1 DUF2946 domain-containing protein [Pseudomonas siliginis]
MNRRRLAFAWIACFAVLFNMLAMPLSGAMAQAASSPAEQILWSSFCTGSGMKMVAIDIGATDQKAPQNDNHSNMQHCWCCSGGAPLLALPGHSPQLYFAQFESNRSVAPVSLQTPTPRQQWPSLNPRASPLV